MLRIAFRFRHGCEFSRLSARHPDAVLTAWCTTKLDVVEVGPTGGPPSPEFERDLRQLAGKGYKVLRRSELADQTTLLLRCGHPGGRTIEDVIEDEGGLVLHPVIYHGGWEQYRIVALDDARVDAMFRRLRKEGELEITMKRRADEDRLSHSFFLSTHDLLSSLTEKQASSLLAALEQGYYEVPRRTRTEDVARRLNVPRTTYEEHLRKAERKVLRNLQPYVELFVGPRSAAGPKPRVAA